MDLKKYIDTVSGPIDPSLVKVLLLLNSLHNNIPIVNICFFDSLFFIIH